MKIKTLAIVVLSALSLSSTAALAETTPTTVNGGTVHFKGEVVNAACAVDAGSVDQTVQLGQVRTASLKQTGATSSAVGFNIQLNDCDTSVATKAAVAFLGTAIDSAHPKVLALQSSAAGSATNVGVQILDRTGNELTLDGATFSAQTTLNNGTNTIPFQARYYAIGEEPIKLTTSHAGVSFTSQILAMVVEIIMIAGINGTRIETPKEGRLFISTG